MTYFDEVLKAVRVSSAVGRCEDDFARGWDSEGTPAGSCERTCATAVLGTAATAVVGAATNGLVPELA